MNSDLTIKTLSFKLRASDIKDGSERREVSRGVNRPTIMTIRSQDATDSASKKPIKRTVLRFDRMVSGTDGQPIPVSAYLVTSVPTDAAVTTADVQNVVGLILGTLDDTAPNLNLVDAIYVNGEQ